MAVRDAELAELAAARGHALKRFAYLLCGNEAEAEDLVQDALLRALSRRAAGHATGGAEAYVRRILTNRFLDLARRRTRWRRLEPTLAQDMVAREPGGSLAEEVSLRGDLMQALKILSPRQRACVVLRFYEDLTVPQVAERLGCAQGTVKGYLNDAITRLADALDIPRLATTSGYGKGAP